MTNPPGEGEGHERQDPQQPGHWQQQPQQPGHWQQQPQQQGSWGQAPGYGYPPPGGYPPPYPAGGSGPYLPDHPRATTSLVLGILSVVLCQVLGPFAWAIGKRTVNEIDASQGRYGGRGSAQAGYVLGVVGTVLLGLVLLYVVFLIVVIGVAGTASL